jgi:hypothetical protein
MYITGDHFIYLMAGLSSTPSKARFMASAAILDVSSIVPQASGTENVSIGVQKAAHLVVVNHITVTCSICLYSIFIIKICMYVCMCVCVHTHTHIYIYICMYV